MERLVTRYIPPRVRWLIRKAVRTLYYLPVDLADTVLGRRDPLTPPRSKIFVGGSKFRRVGEALCRQLVEFGGLEPDHVVLDIGCGIGRAAVPLTRFLTEEGEYYGFDVVKEGIDWCAKQITSRFPHFHFELSDVYNKVYNSRGRYSASEYRFPYEDGYFDFAFATSVFTHMLPADVWNYIAEIGRVLKPGGRCFATYFLLNDESRSLINSGESSLGFQYQHNGSMTVSDLEPEKAIAYDEQTVRDVCGKQGLEIVEPVRYGFWSGRKTRVSYQDIVIVTKSGRIR
jgi:SAM-dependent methyltransferase